MALMFSKGFRRKKKGKTASKKEEISFLLQFLRGGSGRFCSGDTCLFRAVLY
jgi:hypothetical protein